MFNILNWLFNKTENRLTIPYSQKTIAEGKICDPLITMSVQTAKYGFLDIKFLFDSGADVTLFPLKPYAQLFGIKTESLPQLDVYGIGKKVTAYRVTLNFKINNQTYPIRCYFAEAQTIPLLGRLDWWDKFSFELNNQRQTITLTEL